MVNDLNMLGYNDVDADDLTMLRIHNVSSQFIRRLQKKGYDHLSIDDLVKIRIHNINL